MVKKKESRKSLDKKKFKAKFKGQKVSKEKGKKASNRSSRVYQRKTRVGNDPKKIFARIKHIFRRIFWDDLRCRVAMDIVKCGDLDKFIRMFRGTIEDGYEVAADTVDLMVELVQLLQQNQLHFRPKYSKKVSLKFHKTDVTISWPHTPIGACAHDFTNEFMLVHEGKIYHNHWCGIETPTGFSHELVNMENVPEYLSPTKFSDFLERFNLSFNDMKKILVSKDDSDSDEDFIVPRQSENRSKLSKNTKQIIPKPRLQK